jgi:hypothetical protein
MPDTDDLIRSFLAERDFPCPGCACNLRGVGEPRCPECGRAIELTLTRPARSRGYLWFVLLALCWVLAASTMNGLRWWRTARNEANPNQWVQQLISGPGSSVSLSSRWTPGTPGTVVTLRNSRTLVVSGGSVSLTPMPVPSWSSVSDATWAVLSFWTALGIAAITSAILCLIGRRSFDGERAPRGPMAAAIVLFSLYAGYHLILFAREYIS